MRMICLVVAMASLIVGCHRSPETVVIGAWKQDKSGGHSDLVSAIASSLTPSASLEVNANHTFVMKLPDFRLEISNNSSSMQTEDFIEGDWTMKDNEMTFTVKQIAGKPAGEARRAAADVADQERRRAASQPAGSPGSKVNVALGALVLPQTATLSDDQKRLLVRFENGVEQPAEMSKN